MTRRATTGSKAAKTRRVATAGLDRAHHAIFYSFYPGAPSFALLRHDASPWPLYHAYALLAQMMTDGATRLSPLGHEDGSLDDGLGAVLASRDTEGTVRLLLVNRSSDPRSVQVELDGEVLPPGEVLLFDDPEQAPATLTPAATLSLPGRSLALLRL